MNTVWVIQSPLNAKGRPINIDYAKKWGTIQFITGRSQYVEADELEDFQIPSSILEQMHNAAKIFNPLTDYLLIAGDQLQLLQFLYFLSTFHKNGVWGLRWDTKKYKYFAVKFIRPFIPVTLTRRSDAATILTPIP